MIPQNLEEAIDHILDMDGVDKHLQTMTAIDFSTEFHNNVGRWIRNNWNLWVGNMAYKCYDTELYHWFYRRRLSHPDDISTVILEAAHHRYHGKDYDFKKEIFIYQCYWNTVHEERFKSIVEKTMQKVEEKIKKLRDPEKEVVIGYAMADGVKGCYVPVELNMGVNI